MSLKKKVKSHSPLYIAAVNASAGELEAANEKLQSINEKINIAHADLKAANIALKKKDALLIQAEINTQALLNNNMQSFILIDDLYKIIAFNQLASKTFKEISKIKLVKGADFRKLLSRKELTAFENDFKTALKGKAVEAERTIFNGTEKTKTFLLNFTPVADGSRQARRISFGMLDITKQKNAEREIEQLSWVTRQSNNLVLITDQNRKIEWVNHAFEKLTGYKLNQVKGKIPGDVLLGTNSDKKTVAKIRKALKNQEPSIGEILLFYTKAGKEIWVSADAIPIVREGKMVNFVSVMTDLTDLLASNEIKDKQKTILQKQKLFDAIAQYFPNGILGVINKDLKYEFVGGTELKKLGLSHKHLIGDRIFDKIHSQSTEMATPFLKKAFSNETITFEVSIKDSLYQVIAIPINNFPEPISQAVVVIQNITQVKRTEAELTRALKRQKELIDMKSKFVTIASHEFRTPLSTILSSTFLLGKYNTPEDAQNRQKHLDRIKNSVTNLTSILNDFLAIGQIDEGTIKNRPGLFNIQSFFNDLIDEMRAYLKPGQKIIFTHRGNCDIVSLDNQHFKNVFINLLSNAIKYSAESKPILVHSDYSKKYLKISVKDEGIGIPKEDQKNLFQTFFRGNNVSNIQGTGMGLHIIQKYLEIMGGSIDFTSKTDVGSTFTVKFPQTCAEALKS